MKPSFVFILADDLGYADLGCYGGREDTSPVIDRLAREGLRFTDAYANSPVCSPTRFALATGRWQYRLRGGADEPITGAAHGSPVLGLPPSHPTLASLLRDSGHATALIGKWHLGYPPSFGPLQSGYEEFFGLLGGCVDYFSHCDATGRHDLHQGGTEIHRTGYLTDVLSERAADYIRRHEGRPYLLSLHYTAPHWPWEAREDEAESRRIASIVHTDGGSVATYLRMVRQMDEGIGQVLEAIRDTGGERDTIVVFTSDNGGERFSDGWPLTGSKMDLLEGGIRVPAIVRWPRGVEPGSVTTQPAITMDWMATFLEAARVAPHPAFPLDGASLLETFRQPKAPTSRDLYWRMHFRQQRAMRSGAWKYLSIEGDEFLFNLDQDARERANFARREPGIFADLRDRYAAWHETMPPIPPDATASLAYTSARVARSAT